MNFSHQSKFRIYAEDVDHMGIMYHANHLRYFERARTELLRAHSLTLTSLAKQGTHFAIHDIQIRYFAPAKLDDHLTICSNGTKVRPTTLGFTQFMYNESNTLLCKAEVLVVCLDDKHKPKRLPELRNP